jgi:filamentous hemagglutinin family protein
MKKSISLHPITLAVSLALSGQAFAVGDGNITNGTGSISKDGNVTNVKQSSDNMTIDWNNMNVGRDETLNFNQHRDTDSVLNRVNSPDPTEILGKLNANGNVYIVNPNGVLIGNGAQLNVGSLVASSLNISDDDFMKNAKTNGELNFTGEGKGKVVNEGTIQAKRDVVLMGAGEVTNNGRIETENGNATLASAQDITLSLYSVGPLNGVLVKLNKGSVNALVNNGGFIITKNGSIKLTAWALDALTRSVINNTGTLEAKSGWNSFFGGKVDLVSEGSGDINVDGTIRANGNFRDGITVKTGEKGTVNFGDADLDTRRLEVTADNVLTKNGGDKLKLKDNTYVTVNAASADRSFAVGDKAKRDDKGVIDEGFVKAVTRSGNRSSLDVRTQNGSIEVNNGDIDYGTRSVINNTGTLEAAADNSTRGKIELSSEGSGNINVGGTLRTSGSNDEVTIRASAKNTVQLTGQIDSKTVTLQGGTVTQSASGKLNTRTLNTDGDVDLSKGTNDVTKVNATGKSLNLKTIGDTSVDASVSDGLTVESAKNLTIKNASSANGNVNLKAKQNVTIDGRVNSSNGYVNITGTNVRRSSSKNDSINGGKGVTVTADENIELTNVRSTYGDVKLTAKRDISIDNLNARNTNVNSSGGNVTIDNVYSTGTTQIDAAKRVSIGDMRSYGDATIRGNDGITLKRRIDADRNLTLKTNGDVIQSNGGKITVGRILTYQLGLWSKTQTEDGKRINSTAGITTVGERIPRTPPAPPPPTPWYWIFNFTWIFKLFGW